MSEVSKTPEYILRYMAPMVCGEKEREELIRRKHEIEQLAHDMFIEHCELEHAKMLAHWEMMQPETKHLWLEKASKIIFERGFP